MLTAPTLQTFAQLFLIHTVSLGQAWRKAGPEPVIRKLADKCEPPTWIECHNLVISDGDTDN